MLGIFIFATFTTLLLRFLMRELFFPVLGTLAVCIVVYWVRQVVGG